MKKRWYIIAGLAMGLPSTIFVLGLLLNTLVEMNILSEGVAFLLLMVVIIHVFYLMFYYAVKNKNKNKS